MTSRMNEAVLRPLVSLPGSVALTSAQATATPCHKLVIVFTVTGNLTIRTLDGNSVTLTGMPVGAFTLDVQFDMVTWTGTATAAGFYAP